MYSNLWMFLLLESSDQQFHSAASFNAISIAGVHLHTLVVARSGKLRQAFRSSRKTFC